MSTQIANLAKDIEVEFRLAADQIDALKPMFDEAERRSDEMQDSSAFGVLCQIFLRPDGTADAKAIFVSGATNLGILIAAISRIRFAEPGAGI